MIILTQTTDKVEVLLGGSVVTNQLECLAFWRDTTASAFDPGRVGSITNDTTAVDLVPAPAASTNRIVDRFQVSNTDTANAVVTVRYDFNGTKRQIFKATLAAGEMLEYTDGAGFKVFATTGAIKNSINQGANASTSGLTAIVLASDVINNNAVANTIQDVTGLGFPVLNAKQYYFKFIIFYTAQATTTGSRWCVRADAGTAATLSMISEYSLTTTTSTRNGNVQGFDLPAATNASSASTGNNMAVLEGFFQANADANFIARFASEVLSSAITAKAGSVCYYQRLN